METVIFFVALAALITLAVLFKSKDEPATGGPLMDRTRPGTDLGDVVSIGRDSESFGTGCLIQLLGLMFPVIGLVLGAMLGSALGNGALGNVGLVLGASGGLIGAAAGVLVMLALLVVGSTKARFYRCTNCMNRVVDAKVRLCPTCHAALKPPPSITDGF